jgi:hypothetical protein
MTWRFLRFAFSIAICTALCNAANGQQVPSETDLKAAYCLPIIMKTTDMFAESLSKGMGASGSPDGVSLAQALAGYRENVKRLQSYLDSRSTLVDQAALNASAQQANADFQRAQADLASCAAVSGQLGDADPCVQASQAVRRVTSCENLSFLPF